MYGFGVKEGWREGGRFARRSFMAGDEKSLALLAFPLEKGRKQASVSFPRYTELSSGGREKALRSAALS